MKVGIWKLNEYAGGTEVSLIELAHFIVEKLGHEVYLFGEKQSILSKLWNEWGLEVRPKEEIFELKNKIDVLFLYGQLFREKDLEELKVIPNRIQVVGGYVPRTFDYTGNWVTGVIAKSREVGNWIEEILGNRAEVDIMQVPIDLKHWQERGEGPEKRELIGLGKELVIGTVGRVASTKGMEKFPVVLSKIKATNKTAKFLMVGGIQTQKGLQKEVDELKQVKDLIVCPTEGLVRSWYSVLDIFVMLSTIEGVPRSLMEAMAMGKPCVVHDVGGVADLNPKYMFSPGCDQEFNDCIKELADNKKFRESAGKENKKRIASYNKYMEAKWREYFERIENNA